MPAVDNHPMGEGLLGPINNSFAITPHATDELAIVTRGLSVNASGTVSYIAADDTVAVTVFLSAGVIHPIRAKAVRVAGTVATGIHGHH